MSYDFETNVPLPDKIPTRIRGGKYQLAKMPVGSSFFVPFSDSSNKAVVATVTQFSRGNMAALSQKMKFTTKFREEAQMVDGFTVAVWGTRVWRLV